MSNYAFYTGTYLGDTVPQGNFAHFEGVATAYLSSIAPTADATSNAYKMALCSVADVLFGDCPEYVSINGKKTKIETGFRTTIFR